MLLCPPIEQGKACVVRTSHQRQTAAVIDRQPRRPAGHGVFVCIVPLHKLNNMLRVS